MTLASKITLIRIAFIPMYMVFMYQSGGQPGVYPTDDEVALATEILVVAVKLAALEKYLKA